MTKSLTLVAVSALALAAAACGRTDGNAAAVSADDNMLIPADEGATGDAANLAAGNDAAMMGGNDAMADNAAAPGNAM